MSMNRIHRTQMRLVLGGDLMSAQDAEKPITPDEWKGLLNRAFDQDLVTDYNPSMKVRYQNQKVLLFRICTKQVSDFLIH